MKETRQPVIIDEYVDVSCYGTATKYYRNLGYDCVHGDVISVHIGDLQLSSDKEVLCECPVCGDRYYRAYKSITRAGGSTTCKRCSNIVDLEGEVFGRLFVVKISELISSNHRQALWECRCECGNDVTVSSNALTQGRTTSCGCYHSDVLKMMRGSKHPNWKELVAVLCEQCGEEFYVKPYNAGVRKFCSNECSSEFHRGQNHPCYIEREAIDCLWCGNEFYVTPYFANSDRRRVYCSDACASEAKREKWTGSNHPAWNDQLTDEQRNSNRDYLEYSLWRTAVYERDDYQCQACGSRKSNTLCAHHLYDYSTYVAYQTELWNGVTLCNDCHHDFHYNFMTNTRESCTPEDYYDWLEQRADVSVR